MRRMQKAEDQLWQVENNAKHALPTLHGELNELRGNTEVARGRASEDAERARGG